MVFPPKKMTRDHNSILQKSGLRWSLLALCLALPYLVFYLILPFVSRYMIGNDYSVYPIQNQMYLMFSLSSGSFPLFIPGFYSGHASAALTLGEIFHPLSHLAAALPGYWQGLALEWNTLLRLLSLGMTHWLLMTLLVRMRLRIPLAFLVSFLTVYNLRMLDTFRFGAALEAYTAHLMLVAAIGQYFLSRSRWGIGPLLITAFTYLLVVCGHPQMMYYGFLGVGMFVVLFPFYSRTILSEDVDIKAVFGFWARTAMFMGLGIWLASAYIFPFYFDFVLTNTERVGRDFAWANRHLDTWTGAAGNFVSPMLSSYHGAFGMSALISMVLILPVLTFFRIRIPRIIWTLWGILLLLCLGMQGGKTQVYPLFWKYAPLADSFRVPGRISFLALVPLMLLLTWVLKERPPGMVESKRTPANILAGAALLITIAFNSVILFLMTARPQALVQLLAKSGIYVFGLNDMFLSQSPVSVIFLIVFILGAGLLAFFAFTDVDVVPSKALVLVCLLAVIQVTIVIRHGTFYRVKQDVPTYKQILQYSRAKLGYPFYPGVGLSLAAVSQHQQRFFAEPYLAKLYKDVIPVSNTVQAYAGMEQHLTPQVLYVEDPEGQIGPRAVGQGADEPGGEVRLDFGSCNRLDLSVDTPSSAFLGLAYPFSDYWKAWVNGRPVKTFRVNGLYVGLQVPAGRNQVEIRYSSPPAFWGAVSSCSAIFVLGLGFVFLLRSGRVRIATFLSVAALSFGVFYVWHTGLYSGEDIGPAYRWRYRPSGGSPNLAYGKPVTMSVPLPQYHTGMALVDGDTYPNSGAVSSFMDEPELRLDLLRLTSIKRIVLFESGNRQEAVPNRSRFGLVADFLSASTNIRPLVIESSRDGQAWQVLGRVTQPKQPGQPLVLNFDHAHPVRYLRIKGQAGGLGFDEVEVY